MRRIHVLTALLILSVAWWSFPVVGQISTVSADYFRFGGSALTVPVLTSHATDCQTLSPTPPTGSMCTDRDDGKAWRRTASTWSEVGSASTPPMFWPAGSCNGGETTVYRSKVTLTDAQIKALPTTPITTVAAPGAGRMIVPIQVNVHGNFQAGGYTNIDVAGYMQILFNTDGWSQTLGNDNTATAPAGGLVQLTNFLAGADENRVVFREAADVPDVALEWGVVSATHGNFQANQPMKVIIENNGDGNLTGGNGANTMEVVTYYRIETFPATTPAKTDWSQLTGGTAYAFCDEGNVAKAYIAFPDAEDITISRTFMLPAGWTGAVDLNLYWRTSATTGNVVWNVATGCTADNETRDPTMNAAQSITDAANGTTLRQNLATQTSLTTTGCAALELFHFSLRRAGTVIAGDTITAEAQLMGVQLTFRGA